MKALLTAALLSASLLHAGLFDKPVHFKHADASMERKTPAKQEYLLSYNNVLEDVRTSVVNISTEKSVQMGDYANPFFNDPMFRDFFRGFGGPGSNVPQDRVQRALGSGVIVSSDGYIVTNNHVIDGADTIKVSVPDRKEEYEAKLIGTDPKSDLAVIKIEAKDLNAITFYNSDNVRVGDVVFALGNPFGVGETITHGIVSATGRSSVGIVEYEDFIQTDASINPGNSGGALVNSAGQLIGINSAIVSKSGGNVGIGFAIPSKMVENIAKALIDSGEFTRAYLGVGISDMSDDLSEFYGKKFGALVTSVEAGSSAEKIGLKRGDLIVAVNGKEVESASALRNMIGTMRPDTEVTVRFLRNKTAYERSVTLGSRKDAKMQSGYGFEYEGMTVEPLTEQLRRSMGLAENFSGVFVSKVEPKSAAQRAGIVAGDIVVQVEESEIGDIEAFKNAVGGMGKKRLYIFRRGMILVVAL
jgi:serine protease Do